MASIIRIKRSTTAGDPSTLGDGELAYSAADYGTVTGGGRLYIGIGTETDGNAASHLVIGGKYFTDKLDHALGTLTAESAIITDSNNKINNLKVDNIDIDGNTISTTDTDGNLILSPNGVGVISADNSRISNVSNPSVAQDVVTLNYLENYVNDESIQDLVGNMIQDGNTENGIVVTYDDTNAKLDFDVNDFTITLAGDLSGSVTITDLASATLTATVVQNAVELGVDTTGNYVATIADEGEGNIVVTNSGTETAAVLLDLTETGVENNGATWSGDTHTFGSSTAIPQFTVDKWGRFTMATTVALNANSYGTFNVTDDNTGYTWAEDGSIVAGSNADSMTFVAGDGMDLDVDSTNEAILIRNIGVRSVAGTTNQVNITAATGDNVTFSLPQDIHTGATPTFTGANFTDEVDMGSNKITNLAEPTADSDAATKYYVDAARTGLDVKASVRATTDANITLSGTQTVNTVALSVGDRVLVKDQTDKSENGIYVVASGAWTRSDDADQPAELNPGTFVFVEEGDSTYENSGWVVSSDGTLTIGTDDIEFVRFSGTGQIIAGDALSKTGNIIDLEVDGDKALEIVDDKVGVKATIAGAGLTYTTGVVDIVGTANRITVNADNIDIASTYVGQTSINTLGTITTGVWNGTTVAVADGGTGRTTFTTNGVLYGNGQSGLLATATASIDGSFLKQDATGAPYMSNEIDGGTY
jgi:hypothetical protein